MNVNTEDMMAFSSAVASGKTVNEALEDVASQKQALMDMQAQAEVQK